MVALTHFILAASFAGLTAVQGLSVTNPTASSWWVASSANTLSWDCSDKTHDTFTIVISNTDPTILVAPMPIIAIQNNFDCSKLITPEQSSQKAATGYRILLANTLNVTDIFAQSDEFEIKPVGSAYPPTATTPGASSAGAATGSGASGAASAKPTSGATSSLQSFGLGASAAIAAGLAYFM